MPYGLGGSFGGIPYESPASALASGISEGQSIILRGQEANDRRENMAYERKRQDRIDSMNQAHMQFMENIDADKNKRENFAEAWKVHEADQAAIGQRQTEILARHGGDMRAAQADPEFQNDVAPAIDKWNDRHNLLMESVYRDTVDKGMDQAKQTAANLALPEGHPDALDPNNPQHQADLTHMLSVVLKKEPSVILRPPEGGQSPLDQYIGALHDAATKGTPSQVSSAIQDLHGEQVEGGQLGRMDPAGGIITSAVLNPNKPFVPTPDGSKAMPVLTTTGLLPDGSTTTQPYAPPVKNMADTGQSDLHAIGPKDFFDNLGSLGNISALAAHPAVQNAVRETMKDPPPDLTRWQHAWTAVGAGNQTTTHIEEIGGKKYAINMTKSGQEISRTDLSQGVIEPPKNDVELVHQALTRQVASHAIDQAEMDKREAAGITGRNREPNAEELREQAARALIGRPKPDGSGVYTADDINAQIARMGGAEAVGKISPEAHAKEAGDYEGAIAALADRQVPDPMGLGGFSAVKDGPEGDAQIESARRRIEARHQGFLKAEGISGRPVAAPNDGSGKVVAGSDTPANAGATAPLAPPDVSQRKIGTTYKSPRGDRAIWRGNGWEPVGAAPAAH